MRTGKFDMNDKGALQNVVSFGPGLELSGARMHFDRNEEIFGEDEPADYVYRVVTGAVRTMRFTSDGRRQILGFHLPGDIFGLEMGGAHTLSAEALVGSDIVLVRRSLLDKAAGDNPAGGRALVAVLSDSLHRARDHAMMLTHKGAQERVATFLLRLADRSSSGQELDLPMSRADIGDYLGLTIETVSRAFTEMQRQSTIALRSSRCVVMKNYAALTHLEAA